MSEKTAEFQKRSEEARNNPVPNENQSSISSNIGEQKFNMFCHSCHDINTRLVGPPVKEIQGIYKDNPEGIVVWTKAPGKKRADYPQMPAIPIADEELLSIAKYMLQIE
jgi:cytochrome c